MISFDQAGGGGGEWKKVVAYNGAPRQSVVHLFFDVVRTKDFWRYFWRLKKLQKNWPEDHLLDPLPKSKKYPPFKARL